MWKSRVIALVVSDKELPVGYGDSRRPVHKM